MNHPDVHYSTNQLHGRAMAVFRGTAWQRGYGQTGYGLGGLFRALGRFAKPIFKTTLKGASRLAGFVGKPVFKGATQAARDIAIDTAVQSMGDVLSGKNPKEILKHRGLQALNAAKGKPSNACKPMLNPDTENEKERLPRHLRRRDGCLHRKQQKRDGYLNPEQLQKQLKRGKHQHRRKQKQKTAVDIFG